jgi:hypothetical protein
MSVIWSHGVIAADLRCRQLGRGNLNDMWLTLRRVIALAELLDLPEGVSRLQNLEQCGSMSVVTRPKSLVATQAAETELWDAICATDRNASMMLNLPPATAAYTFPNGTNRFVVQSGRVSAQAYNYHLSSISVKLYEIDKLNARGAAPLDCYELVLQADRDLRQLAASATQTWWNSHGHLSLADRMVQFWHHYVLARIHLRLATVDDVEMQFSYSRSTCYEACKDIMRRFCRFRKELPAGFFVCRIVDLQAMTAAVVLLSACLPGLALPYSSTMEQNLDASSLALVDEVLGIYSAVLDRAGSDFAQQAIETLSAIRDMVTAEGTDIAKPREVRIPLLGRVHLHPKKLSKVPVKSCPLPRVSQYGSGEHASLDASTREDGMSWPDFGSIQWDFDLDLRSSWPDSFLVETETNVDYHDLM